MDVLVEKERGEDKEKIERERDIQERGRGIEIE
jgi:hypothetical protein